MSKGRLGKRLLIGAAVATLVGCGASAPGPLPPTGAAARASRTLPRLERIAVVVMENHEYGEIIGNPQAPRINALSRAGALATTSHAITHPSLPNYLALLGGSTFGIDSDCTDCRVGARNLVDQLAAAHISWRAYMDGMPTACFRGAGAGRYAKKHDPFMYFDDIAGNPARCGNVVPGTRLSADIAAHRLPRLTWITPDLCEDMHDCSVATGDRYLAGLLPRLIAALGPRGVVFVTWDEGSSDAGCCRLAAGGRIVTMALGGAARAHARVAIPYDHYSLLRTIEDAWGLPELRSARCSCSVALSALLRAGARGR